MNPIPEGPAERVARLATATGVGFLALMPAWLLGVRLAALVWQPPAGPIVALLSAITISMVAGSAANRRLRPRGP
jgi:hypothetical protein